LIKKRRQEKKIKAPAENKKGLTFKIMELLSQHELEWVQEIFPAREKYALYRKDSVCFGGGHPIFIPAG